MGNSYKKLWKLLIDRDMIKKDLHESCGLSTASMATFYRSKSSLTQDGVPYDGIVVNMGVINPDGSICYIIGIRKDIRAKIGKQAGEMVKVTICERV